MLNCLPKQSYEVTYAAFSVLNLILAKEITMCSTTHYTEDTQTFDFITQDAGLQPLLNHYYVKHCMRPQLFVSSLVPLVSSVLENQKPKCEF